MLKNKIKVASLVCASLLAITGCGGGKEAVNAEITVWCAAEEEAVLNDIVSAYNATQTEDTQKFNVKFVAVSEADAGTTVAKDPTAADAPALFNFADDQLYTLQGKQILLELKGDYKTRTIANNSAVSVTGASYNGKLYAFPYTSDNGYFLWYDADMLDDSKIGSLEDILSYCAANDKSILMDVANGWYANSFIMSPEACGTTSLFWKENADGKAVYETTWDNEAGVKVSSYIASLLTPAFTDGNLIKGGNAEIVAGFKDKTLCAAISGTWMEKDLTMSGRNIKAAKLPSYHVDGKAYQMATFTGSKLLGINATKPVAEQKAAVALAELLCNKESQLKRFAVRKTLPCNNEAAADPAYTQNVSMGGKALVAQTSVAAAVQSLTAEGRYWDVGKAIGQAYLDGDLGGAADWAAFLKQQMDILRSPGT